MQPSGTRKNKRKFEPVRPIIKKGRISTAGSPSPGHGENRRYQDLLSSLPPTSWLYYHRSYHFPEPPTTDDEAMESPMLTSVPVLPKLRTIRFDPIVLWSSPDERYLSSEEEASTSSGDDSASSLDRWDPAAPGSGSDDEEDETLDDRFVATAASGIDEQVARTITFIAPGKPRIIDVNTFAPIQARCARLRENTMSRFAEPPVRRRICENRELDRIIKSRSWISRAFSQEDLLKPRRLTFAPLDGGSSDPSDQARTKLRRANSSRAMAMPPADASALTSCGPSRMNVAPSKLRGVAHSLMSAKRKARLAEALC